MDGGDDLIWEAAADYSSPLESDGGPNIPALVTEEPYYISMYWSKKQILSGSISKCQFFNGSIFDELDCMESDFRYAAAQADARQATIDTTVKGTTTPKASTLEGDHNGHVDSKSIYESKNYVVLDRATPKASTTVLSLPIPKAYTYLREPELPYGCMYASKKKKRQFLNGSIFDELDRLESDLRYAAAQADALKATTDTTVKGTTTEDESMDTGSESQKVHDQAQGTPRAIRKPQGVQCVLSVHTTDWMQPTAPDGHQPAAPAGHRTAKFVIDSTFTNFRVGGVPVFRDVGYDLRISDFAQIMTTSHADSAIGHGISDPAKMRYRPCVLLSSGWETRIAITLALASHGHGHAFLGDADLPHGVTRTDNYARLVPILQARLRDCGMPVVNIIQINI